MLPLSVLLGPDLDQFFPVKLCTTTAPPDAWQKFLNLFFSTQGVEPGYSVNFFLEVLIFTSRCPCLYGGRRSLFQETILRSVVGFGALRYSGYELRSSGGFDSKPVHPVHAEINLRLGTETSRGEGPEGGTTTKVRAVDLLYEIRGVALGLEYVIRVVFYTGRINSTNATDVAVVDRSLVPVVVVDLEVPFRGFRIDRIASVQVPLFLFISSP